MLPSFLRGAFASFSDHVVYTSSLYGEMRSQMTTMGGALINFEREARSEADRRCRRLAAIVRPTNTSQTLIRIGGDSDGAYVMVDDFNVATAISLGVGHDVSWDADIAARGVVVHMFDPTVAGPPSPVPGARFHAIGVGTPIQAAASGLDLQLLDDLVDLTGVAAGTELILKIDVEGAEWDSLDAAGDFSRYRQIVLELHDLDQLADADRGDRMVRVLERINETHASIHVHANNDAPLAHFDAYWFPTVLEVSFVRRDVSPLNGPALSLREDLDRPSNPRFADLSLRGILRL